MSDVSKATCVTQKTGVFEYVRRLYPNDIQHSRQRMQDGGGGLHFHRQTAPPPLPMLLRVALVFFRQALLFEAAKDKVVWPTQ